MAEISELKGYHILADFIGCPPKYLERVEDLRDVLLGAAKAGGFNVVGQCFYQFEPRGVTGVVLLEQSHISGHSWPELGFIAVDIYSCGGMERAQKAKDHLTKMLKPEEVNVREVYRFR